MTKNLYSSVSYPYFNGAKSESEVRRNEGMNLLVLKRQWLVFGQQENLF
jgi:hypothetical protein